MTTHVLNVAIHILRVCVCVCVCVGSWTNIHINELKYNHNIALTGVRVQFSNYNNNKIFQRIRCIEVMLE